MITPHPNKKKFPGVALVNLFLLKSLTPFGPLSDSVPVTSHSYLLLTISKLEARSGVPCVANIRHFFCCTNQPLRYLSLQLSTRLATAITWFLRQGGEAEVWKASVGQGLN